MNKKLAPAAGESQHEVSVEEAEEDLKKVVEVKAFKCEQCGNDFKSENGLNIHIGKAHKVILTPPPPDRLRQQPGSTADIKSSPFLEASREEAGEEKDEPVSPLQPLPSPQPASPHAWRAGCRCERCLNWHGLAEAGGYYKLK